MLGSFMDDIGISADQFEAACRLSANDLTGFPTYFHKRLFEQIWAANDYEMFVKMMTHKNVELQLQVNTENVNKNKNKHSRTTTTTYSSFLNRPWN